MYLGMFDPTIILMIPAIIFTMWAQAKIRSAYGKYSRIPVRSGITGAQAARMILDSNGMRDVPIQAISGQLTDNYDPKDNIMHLSGDIYHSSSIAAVSVAAHESGHAIQDETGYSMLRFRTAIVPVVNLVSYASWPLILIGLVLVAVSNYAAIGNILLDLGVIFFCVVVLFHAVTLPVELNASSRAIRQLQDLNIICDDEVRGARKVLSAAAMTYVAALASSVMTLLRILLIRGRN